MVSFNRGLLMISATFVTLSGISLFVEPKAVFKSMGVSVEASPLFFQILGVSLLGWGAGKGATVLTGSEEAVTAFATFNLCPVAMSILNSMPPNGTPWPNIMFLIGYLYIVTTGPRKAAASTSWPIGFYFLCFSAFFITCQGVATMYDPDSLLKYMGVMNPGRAMTDMMGISSLGWAVGKWSCVYNGDAAVFLFCKVNLIAMVASISIGYFGHDYQMMVSGLFFFIAYGYLALTGPKDVTAYEKKCE